MKKIKAWWRERHWRKVRKHVIKLSAGEQLGLAQSLISSIAAPYPRESRRKFLQVQFCKIEELVKDLVGDNKRPASKGKI